MEPTTKKVRKSFYDYEQFEKFYQESYKRVSEEVEAEKCSTSDEGDYPLRFPAKRKLKSEQNLAEPFTSTQRPDKASVVAAPDHPMIAPVKINFDMSTRTIEEATGEDKLQSLEGPSTSSQRSDKASVVAAPDHPMIAPVNIKFDMSTRTIEVATGEDKHQSLEGASTSTQRPDKASVVAASDHPENLEGPSTSAQRHDEALFRPIFSKQAIHLPHKAVDIQKCIHIHAGQCEVIFAQEGTFVPFRSLNDTVVRFMKPNNFWRVMHIKPPRINFKFHFYLVVQDPVTATGNLAGKAYVIVAIRKSILKIDARPYIKNLARLTVSQYISHASLDSELHSKSENTIADDPIVCEVMCLEKLPFNPFTRSGRKKSEALWQNVIRSLPATTTSTTRESPTEETETESETTTTKELHDHELQAPIGQLKPLLTSTPLTEKVLFGAAVDNRHEDKPGVLLISKFVYVIPTSAIKRSKKHESGSRTKMPEERHTRDPLRRPVYEYGNNFADTEIIEIPTETYFDWKTASGIECDDSE